MLNDTISRQALLDAIDNERKTLLDMGMKDAEHIVVHHARRIIEELPPVNPQYTDEEIQKMQDLEQAEIQKAYELGKAEMQPSEDAISRQAVLEVIRKCHCEEWIKADIGAPIEALPPVNPQEPKWIPVSERLSEERKTVLSDAEFRKYFLCESQESEDCN